MKVEIDFQDFKEVRPKTKKWYICIVKEYHGNECHNTLRSGFWEDGQFWSNEREDAWGIGEVLYWADADDFNSR
jgi:hypothetical protein